MARSKFKKTVLVISCALLLIVYLCVNGMGNGLISFQTVQAVNTNPQKFNIEMMREANIKDTSSNGIKYVFNTNTVSQNMSYQNTTYNDTAVQKQIQLTSRLYEVGSPSKCDDIEWLHYIVKIEKECHLQPGELFSVIYTENSFTHKTVFDGNSLSYGCTQMKMNTAMDAYRQIKSMGKEIAKPTENLLRNDKLYLTRFTGLYLEFLNEKSDSPYQAWTSYNKGFGNTQYKSTHYVCDYSNNIFRNMTNFAITIGDAY